MGRVEIELPDRVLFSAEVPIRVRDINYGGHLGNDSVLSIAQEARARFLAAHGLSELDVGGPGIALVDAVVMYRAEGKYGMVLRVDIGAADVRTRECDLFYRMTDVATGAEVALVKTGVVCVDYAVRKIVRLPQAFRRLLGVVPGAVAP